MKVVPEKKWDILKQVPRGNPVQMAVPRFTEIPKFYRNPRIFTEIPLDITEIPIRSSEIPCRWKDKTLF
jgi:hypothetical protein